MAYQRILFCGPPVSADIAKGDTLEDVTRKTTGNTGNMLISHSLRSELKYESSLHWRYKGDPSELCENSNVIVFAASNFLNASYNFTHMADALEKVRLPCVMAGLGAQSRGEGDARITLKEGTRRFIEIVAERSKTVGVRGEFSASVLADMGIRNVEVIGCPSFYAGCSPELRLRRAPPDQLRRVAVNGSRRVLKIAFDRGRMQAAENAVLKDALNYDAEFFVQNGAEEMQLALDPDSLTDEQLEPLTGYYDTIPPQDVVRFFRAKSRLFGSIDDWRTALASFDLAIGTRIHGCVLGMLAGVPPFLITHDTRTEEMSRLLGMPRRRIDDPALFERARGGWLPWKRQAPATDISIRRLYEEADYGALAASYALLYARYKAFLGENNLAHKLA